jgi:hypothetical protein
MTHDQFVLALERELERLGYDELDAFADEDRRVLIWRAKQFVELGFGEDSAVALAQTAADLACTRKLIAAGCSPATAARILL